MNKKIENPEGMVGLKKDDWLVSPPSGLVVGGSICGYNLVTPSALKQSRRDRMIILMQMNFFATQSRRVGRIIGCDELKDKKSRRDGMIIEMIEQPFPKSRRDDMIEYFQF